MSLISTFLNEDTELNGYSLDYGFNENSELFDDNEGNYFCEGVDGLFQISAESEMSWGNIMCESVIRESKATLSEDYHALQEAEDNFFTKVKNWVKEKAAKLKRFFQDLINRIKVSLTNVNKFVTVNASRMAKASGEKEIKTTRKWKEGAPFSKIAGQAKAAAGLLVNSNHDEKVFDRLKVNNVNGSVANALYQTIATKLNVSNVTDGSSFIKAVKAQFYEETKKAESVKIKSNEAQKMFKELINAKVSLKITSALSKASNQILSSVLAAAKVEDKVDAKANRTQNVMIRKTASTVMDSVNGAYTSLLLGFIVDAVKISKKFIKEVKKEGSSSSSTENASFDFGF